jgi:NADH:ubiquinone oxidoreductase subunit D
MPVYADLNDEDKKIVDNTVNLIRASAGEIARMFNHLVAIANDTNATGLVTSLDADAVIPNTSGLAGSDELTRAEVVAIYTALNGIRTTHDTGANRAAWSKAAGINAMLG